MGQAVSGFKDKSKGDKQHVYHRDFEQQFPEQHQRDSTGVPATR
jgi:hypothetical protein